MKKKPPFNQEMSIRGANRRLFARSPIVQEKLAESRQEFPRYKKDGSRAKKNWVKRQCEVCFQWTLSSKIAIDHIDPVVPPNGFPAHFDIWQRINMFLQRLWCDKSNLQRICDPCHDSKTYKEKIDRLTKKYTQELDEHEATIINIEEGIYASASKELIKELTKYVSKKKSPGLEPISARASALRDRAKKYK
jgi:hypothetical protein